MRPREGTNFLKRERFLHFAKVSAYFRMTTRQLPYDKIAFRWFHAIHYLINRHPTKKIVREKVAGKECEPSKLKYAKRHFGTMPTVIGN